MDRRRRQGGERAPGVAPIALTCLLAFACARPAPEETEAPRGDALFAPDYEPPPPGTYSLPPIQPASDGDVVGVDGTARRLFDYLGDRHVLLAFIYTRCARPGGCPLAFAVFRRIERELRSDAELAENVRLVSLSFDPAHDTADVMRRYAEYARGDDQVETPWKERTWVMLTTRGSADLEPILEGYGQYVVREIDRSGKPTDELAHVLKVFLIDRERRVRNIYSSAFLYPELALNDVRTLLIEERGAPEPGTDP